MEDIKKLVFLHQHTREFCADYQHNLDTTLEVIRNTAHQLLEEKFSESNE